MQIWSNRPLRRLTVALFQSFIDAQKPTTKNYQAKLEMANLEMANNKMMEWEWEGQSPIKD
jgi:hypothetical protein